MGEIKFLSDVDSISKQQLEDRHNLLKSESLKYSYRINQND